MLAEDTVTLLLQKGTKHTHTEKKLAWVIVFNDKKYNVCYVNLCDLYVEALFMKLTGYD